MCELFHFVDAKVTFSGHEHNIRAAIFAQFDKQIISASDDKTVRYLPKKRIVVTFLFRKQ
jgi:hypothetical protein